MDREPDPMDVPETAEQALVVLAHETAEVLREFYDDVTPCVHRLKKGKRCAVCGRARALLIECDAVAGREQNPDG